jgi:dolichol kinase
MTENNIIQEIKTSPVPATSLWTEFKRKTVHISSLSIPIGLILVPKTPALLILASCAFIATLLDLLKYYDKDFRRGFYKVFRKVLRPKEIRRFTGSTYILASGLICAVAFDKWVAVTAMSFIIFGDIAGAIFGKRFGTHKTFNNKTLEGSLAFFIAAYSSGIIFKLVACLPTPWSALFMGALTATVIEALPLGIDDNFSVPVLTGLLLQMMYIGLF